MKLKNIIPQRYRSQIVRQFGDAKLIRQPNGQHELVGGTDADRANDRSCDWQSYPQNDVKIGIKIIPRDDSRYPARLIQHLGADAPSELTALGNLDLLALPKTALFCSAKCPGSVILPTYDQAAKWRDTGRCVIGGFHSPVEKECLQILLRGDAPVILCPARAILERLPAQWAVAVASGRMLILSAFPATDTRITAELAALRNEFVATLAEEVLVAHATVGGQLENLIRKISVWGIPQIHL